MNDKISNIREHAPSAQFTSKLKAYWCVRHANNTPGVVVAAAPGDDDVWRLAIQTTLCPTSPGELSLPAAPPPRQTSQPQHQATGDLTTPQLGLRGLRFRSTASSPSTAPLPLPPIAIPASGGVEPPPQSPFDLELSHSSTSCQGSPSATNRPTRIQLSLKLHALSNSSSLPVQASKRSLRSAQRRTVASPAPWRQRDTRAIETRRDLREQAP